MNPSIIRFHHFASEQSYCKLQEIFGSFDFKRDYNTIKVPLKDFKITYYVRDEFCQYEDYKTHSFVKDYAIPGIENLSSYYFNNFRAEVYDKGIFSDELLNGFAKHFKNKIRKLRSLVKKAEYLKIGIKYPLVKQLSKLDELVDEYIKDPYPEIKYKLQFNWSRTDVEYFFHLLRENKVFNQIADADLGRIIDSTMEFQDEERYKPINHSRKHLNDFKNSAERSQIITNERLKKVFMNEDFFNQ